MSEWDDNENPTIDAYRAEVSEHRRLTAARFILQDMGLIACSILRDQDSCLERIRIMKKIPV